MKIFIRDIVQRGGGRVEPTAVAARRRISRDQQQQEEEGDREEEEGRQSPRGEYYNYIEICEESVRKFRNFEIFGREASIRILPPPEGADIEQYLENAFREIRAYAVNSYGANDYVGLTFASTDLTRGPAGLSFRPVRDLTHEDIWGLVTSLAQSAGGHDIVERFEITVFNVAAPSGCGGGNKTNRLTHEDVAKRSIVNIANNDNLCFPRSLIVASVYCERGNIRTGELQRKWNMVRHPCSALQRKFAQELTRDAGVAIPEEGCGIPEIERFQRYLANYKIVIVVYNSSTFARGELPMYDGSGVLASLGYEPKHRLNIMYYEGSRHFSPILNLKAASGSRGYCVSCNIRYRDETGHRCSNVCPRCLASPSCEKLGAPLVSCNACKRGFYGTDCFERHRRQKSYKGESSVCNAVRFCDCGRMIRAGTKHICGRVYCRVCNASKPANHLCFMRPLSRDSEEGEKSNPTRSEVNEMANIDDDDDDNNVENGETRKRRKGRVCFIFYDFETRQDDTIEGTANVKTHVVTLCVAQQVCDSCMGENDTSSRCRWCGVREFVFRDDPVKQLVDLATRTTKCFSRIICIAHNSSAFDSQFILRYLVESGKTVEPEVILNGTRIILLSVGRTKFIDSANYMPMRLSMLPKAFGLKDTEDKGIFPHLFNTRQNQNYVGPLPSVRYYSPDAMKPEEREQFLKWHAEMVRKNITFDFQNEITRYCRNDVNILRRACLAYRKIFIDRGNVCPFEECTTIASTCMRVFRKNFLREKEIGIIPPRGYRFTNSQSRKALQWLVCKERELGHTLIHAGRGREYRLPEGTLVDGYYETENPARRCVLQFHGCFWHGCPSCFRVNRDRPLSNASREDTIDARYERTLATTGQLRKRGYEVTEKWECVFDRELAENREMREFVEKHPMLETSPLDPRDAFYGGRTGNIVTRYEVKGTEKIRYVDVCSLYPYVLKTGAFPLGHPKIYVGEEECSVLIGTAPNFNFDSVEGLVSCRVLPPRDLFHPVLPFRTHGKLLFGLCRSCCETFSQAACSHDDPADREFSGTWVSLELRKAVEKGYRVTSVREIWQYESTRYDPVSRQGGLFVEYINCFLQLKQEASGWPSECRDEDSEERYLRKYEEVEGIVLDRRNIEHNPGLRSVAKLCLNSFWGKFGQRSNLPNTEVVRTNQRFMALLTSPEHEIIGILPVNDEAIYVSWRFRREAVSASSMTNVVIAAYTTAHARLKLYDYLEKLDRRVLYYDTDSCIYLSSGDPDEYEPRTGNFLGDMTDELESYGAGSFIESFVSGGPKFYAYIVRTASGDTREVCKVKGITLNFENSLRVNFRSIKNLLLTREKKKQKEEQEEGKKGEEKEREEDETAIKLSFRAIRRTAFHDIVTRDESKSCAPVLLKRQFNGNHCSQPYGYVSPGE